MLLKLELSGQALAMRSSEKTDYQRGIIAGISVFTGVARLCPISPSKAAVSKALWNRRFSLSACFSNCEQSPPVSTRNTNLDHPQTGTFPINRKRRRLLFCTIRVGEVTLQPAHRPVTGKRARVRAVRFLSRCPGRHPCPGPPMLRGLPLSRVGPPRGEGRHACGEGSLSRTPWQLSLQQAIGRL